MVEERFIENSVPAPKALARGANTEADLPTENPYPHDFERVVSGSPFLLHKLQFIRRNDRRM